MLKVTCAQQWLCIRFLSDSSVQDGACVLHLVCRNFPQRCLCNCPRVHLIDDGTSDGLGLPFSWLFFYLYWRLSFIVAMICGPKGSGFHWSMHANIHLLTLKYPEATVCGWRNVKIQELANCSETNVQNHVHFHAICVFAKVSAACLLHDVALFKAPANG